MTIYSTVAGTGRTVWSMPRTLAAVSPTKQERRRIRSLFA
jgi:hypothetical protein